MRHLKRVVAVAALLFAVPLVAAAQPQWQDKTILSFDGQVQVPGKTLEPGTYLFQLDRSAANRQVVQIWNEERTKLFTTTIAVPIRRVDTTGDVVVKFASTPQGEPPAIKSWYYPGQLTGHSVRVSRRTGSPDRAHQQGAGALV